MLNYQNALSDFDRALEIDPFNPDIFLARGDTKLHIHDYKGAEEDFTSAINLKSKIASAWLSRGIARHFLEKNVEALEDMDKAIYLDYFNVEAWLKRGMIKYDLDSANSAISDYDHALTLDKENPYIYFQRALAYLKSGDTLMAENDYNSVLLLDPNNALTYYNLALLYSNAKEFEKALAAYNEVTRLNPFNVYTYYNRSGVYYQMGNLEEAEEDLTKAIDIFPDFAGAYINRSAIRSELKKTSEAKMDHDRAMQIIEAANGNEPDPSRLYSRYADSAYFSRIIEFEADFIAGDMEHGRIQFERINIVPKPNFYLLISQKQKAISDINTSVEYTDENLSAFNADNALGVKLVYSAEDFNLEDSVAFKNIREVEKLAKLSGDSLGVHAIVGILRMMIHDYSTALLEYHKALQIDPNNTYMYFNRGTLKYEMDQSSYEERRYNTSISVSRSTLPGPQNKVIAPDHRETLYDFDKILRLKPYMAFVYYKPG